ncbi:histone-lysine N-methyltransferase, H3 lysine-79 specific isoform X4 [Drosophila albomicans]|uniref:Histone-lysine N-methyltransferase, H3 lysine-79 specific isoform X4 n=1 Tax=Drosophila albomicans TaxID=7291 RepID=A0A6P8X620_DROAB|nr:histone-lysine N-methyltransferase, H3 lysine-79 specific isoform X4 [Drosophila albomicans]
MSRRGAVILSTVSLLLRRAPASRFRHGGLRLTPPVTTSFALMHRNFSSSSQSDDEGKKQEKHKKGTSPSSLSEVSQGGGTTQKKQQQQQRQPETEVKVVWEYPNDSKVPKKSYQHMEIAHRLGDEVAIRVAKFRTNQKHKQMLAKYEAHRKQMELELEREKQRIEMKMKAEQKLNPNVATPPAKGAANATQKPEESVKVEKQQKSETRKSVAKPGVKRKSSWSLFNWMKRSDDKIKKNETSGKK